MKIQRTLFTILFGLSFFLTNCNLSDENRLKQELVKKDSIIELQKKIIDKHKKYYEFDTITPIVVPENSNLKLGDEYKADIYVAAYKSDVPYEFYTCESLDTVNNKMINIKIKISSENGFVSYKYRPKKKGKYFLNGGIKFYGDSIDKIHLFKKEYYVN
jgi:hypothetical protein